MSSDVSFWVESDITSRMMYILVQMFSFPLICTDQAQTDQQPITTENSIRGRQPEETVTDSNSDTHKENFHLKVENGVVKYKLQNVPESQETSMKDENSTKVCVTIKSHRGDSSSVEQNDPKPLSIVLIQENVVSHKVLLDNYEGKLCEEQRPSTKRQLSAESAAKSVSVRKRSTVKKSQGEIVKPFSVASPGTQSGRPYLPAVSTSQRKPRKCMFSSTDIFSKVDTFSIQKGREVTTHKHTSLCSMFLQTRCVQSLSWRINVLQNLAPTCHKIPAWKSLVILDIDYLGSGVFNWDWS